MEKSSYLQSISRIYLSSTHYWKDPMADGQDAFQVQIEFYRAKYAEEFQAVLQTELNT